jgi:hypothetical protein
MSSVIPPVVPEPTPAPAPIPAPLPVAAPSFGAKLLKTATDTLKAVVAVATTPGGLTFMATVLGTANPAILLVEQFGVRLLGPLLTTWAAPDISDADIATDLATKGYKVVPYDPMAAVNA